MPFIREQARVMSDGTKMMQYTDTVGPSFVTYTLDNEQESLIITNKGVKPIVFSVGTTTNVTLNPGERQTVDTLFTSFQVKSSEGIQQFEVRMDEAGTVGGGGTDPQLSSKVNQLTSQLAEKANKNYVDELIGGIGATSTFKGANTNANILALTGMAVGDEWFDTTNSTYLRYNGTTWVNVGSDSKHGENSVDTNMVKSKSITEDKTSFLMPSVNMFDKSNSGILPGKRLSASFGLSDIADCSVSYYIKVSKGDTLRFKRYSVFSGSIPVFATYKKDLTVISYVVDTNLTSYGTYYEYTVNDDNVKFIRFNITLSDLNGFIFTLNNPYPAYYVPYGYALSSTIKEKNVEYVNPNLISSKYVDGFGALVSSSAVFCYFDIELNYGDTLVITARTATSVMTISEWNKDYTEFYRPCYIPSVSSNQETVVYTSSHKTEYLRISLYSQYIYEMYIKRNGLSYQNEDDIYNYIFSNAIAIGDSLTAGVYGDMVTRPKNYPYFLNKMTGWNIANAGVGGISAKGWWDTEASKYNYANYDLAIVFLGTNDGLTETLDVDATGSDYNQYAATNTGSYCKIIEHMKAQNSKIQIVLCTIFANTSTVAATNNTIYAIAAKYGLPVVNLYKPYLTNSSSVYHSVKSNLHLGQTGYLNLANEIKTQFNDYVYKNLNRYKV